MSDDISETIKSDIKEKHNPKTKAVNGVFLIFAVLRLFIKNPPNKLNKAYSEVVLFITFFLRAERFQREQLP